MNGERGPTGIFDAEGEVLALMEPRAGSLRVLVGFSSG
jgi:hypothetical protein